MITGRDAVSSARLNEIELSVGFYSYAKITDADFL